MPHLPHHMRDETAAIGLLPVYVLPAVERATATRVALTTYPAVLWIRGIDRAQVMDVPEPAWDGWDWAPGEQLLINITRDPHLPKLGAFTQARRNHWQLVVAGAPMRMRLAAPGDPEWVGSGSTGEVTGFLNERTRFWAQAIARTERRRDELLGMIATLTRL